jgi:hypothetical protein
VFSEFVQLVNSVPMTPRNFVCSGIENISSSDGANLRSLLAEGDTVDT